MTDYEILGIPADSSDIEINQAFRKLALKHHPDKGGDPAKFREVYDAYQALTNGIHRNADEIAVANSREVSKEELSDIIKYMNKFADDLCDRLKKDHERHFKNNKGNENQFIVNENQKFYCKTLSGYVWGNHPGNLLIAPENEEKQVILTEGQKPVSANFYYVVGNPVNVKEDNGTSFFQRKYKIRNEISEEEIINSFPSDKTVMVFLHKTDAIKYSRARRDGKLLKNSLHCQQPCVFSVKFTDLDMRHPLKHADLYLKYNDDTDNNGTFSELIYFFEINSKKVIPFYGELILSAHDYYGEKSFPAVPFPGIDTYKFPVETYKGTSVWWRLQL